MSSTNLPDTYRRWNLYGAGLDNVGDPTHHAPETEALAHPDPDEILVRHDACGICFSDIKIINLGPEHPRLVGRDLKKDPVVMGHEVALTVIEVGENYQDKFQPGQRFIVQADVYYQGKNLAYGYLLPGGMSEYALIGKEVLEGDEGCYLLPIQEKTGYAEAALVEPWACVEAAYHWTERTTIQAGDIVFETTPTPDEFENAAAKLGTGNHLFLRGDQPLARSVSVDMGRIHYDGHLYAGSKTNNRSEIKSGGRALMIGAAGPMGQMHVQRALQLAEPPAVLVGTDRQADRLDALQNRLGSLARERGVELILINTAANDAPLPETFGPFDDIVLMVPVPALIEESFGWLAENGVYNIFAGVARGTMATLPLHDVATKNVRIVGTSGSSIADMRRTRDQMEAQRLDTGASLAAIGGLEAFREGLAAVKDGRFPGKTVIFPHIENLPLTALPDLKQVRPNVYEKLKDGQFWTDEAEAELLREAK